VKVKQKPEDFIVEEISEFELSDSGSVYLYKLTKKSLSTMELLKIIQKRFSVKSNNLHICGLKDKHSLSTQLLSSQTKLPKNTDDERFSLEFLGKINERIGSSNLKGNAFTITLRDLASNEIDTASKRFEQIEKFGLVNYFDNQRFGSVRHGNEFVVKHLINKNYEQACKVFLTATSSADRSKDRRRRKFIKGNWGNFKLINSEIKYSEEKPLINHLSRFPRDWIGALKKISKHLKLLLIYAYQSFIWNETAARLVKYFYAADFSAEYLLGKFNFFETLSDEIHKEFNTLKIPLIKHNTTISNETISNLVSQVLTDEKLTIQKFRIRSQPAFYFKEYWRDFVVYPKDLKILGTNDDELNKGKLSFTFSVSLPSGAYATLIIKRLFQINQA